MDRNSWRERSELGDSVVAIKAVRGLEVLARSQTADWWEAALRSSTCVPLSKGVGERSGGASWWAEEGSRCRAGQRRLIGNFNFFHLRPLPRSRTPESGRMKLVVTTQLRTSTRRPRSRGPQFGVASRHAARGSVRAPSPHVLAARPSEDRNPNLPHRQGAKPVRM